MKNIAFIDLEASGLNAQSWPIEVGWRVLGGAHGAHLIKPHADWKIDAWEKKAEALHGISYETLVSTGASPESVCARLNEALADCVVYSDAPEWDGFWLYRLFQVCDLRQAFRLVDFQQAFDDLREAELQPLIERALSISPHTHRAADDVLHMNTLFDLIHDHREGRKPGS